MHSEWVCKADWTGMWNVVLVSGLFGLFGIAVFAKNLPAIRKALGVKSRKGVVVCES